MKDFWNERYGFQEYAYGQAPNEFFSRELKKLKNGTLILPCEGEGRNAVYASKLGWKTIAFDYSEEAKNKALQLAKQLGVQLTYDVNDVLDADFEEGTADAVAFIYAHFAPEVRARIHRKAIKWLKPGGKMLLEAFNPNQLKNNSGGPKKAEMLYTEDALKDDFKELNIDLLNMEKIVLAEGKYHDGQADIIRLIATKK
jgi:hypothetical protein